MLNDLFSIIDPVIEPDDTSLRTFTIQMDAFLASLGKEGKMPVKLQRPLTEEDYKEMWMLRYQQYLGQITFLELLDKYEEILGISSPSDSA